jgi:DNA invertase Pin-like site-specific DNA recombinase
MIQTLIDAGYPIAEIAIVFGVTRSAMYNWISKMQINLTKNKTGV